MLLNYLKTYLGIDITDTSKDTLLELMIKMATTAVLKHCNVSEVSSNVEDGLIMLAAYYYKKRNSTGVISETQGSRSKTYSTVDIPEDIKAVLPLQKVKVVG